MPFASIFAIYFPQIFGDITHFDSNKMKRISIKHYNRRDHAKEKEQNKRQRQRDSQKWNVEENAQQIFFRRSIKI